MKKHLLHTVVQRYCWVMIRKDQDLEPPKRYVHLHPLFQHRRKREKIAGWRTLKLVENPRERVPSEKVMAAFHIPYISGSCPVVDKDEPEMLIKLMSNSNNNPMQLAPRLLPEELWGHQNSGLQSSPADHFAARYQRKFTVVPFLLLYPKLFPFLLQLDSRLNNLKTHKKRVRKGSSLRLSFLLL